MAHGRIEGSDDELHGGRASRAKAWDLYGQHVDRMEDEARAASEKAAEEAALAEQQRAAAARPRGVEPAKPAAGAVVGSVNFGMSLRAALTQTPLEKKMDAMAAMQAEALARLEIAPHADQVVAEQREIDHANPIEVEGSNALKKEKNDDVARKAPTTSASAKPGALRVPTDRVAPAPTAQKAAEKPKSRDQKK